MIDYVHQDTSCDLCKDNGLLVASITGSVHGVPILILEWKWLLPEYQQNRLLLP